MLINFLVSGLIKEKRALRIIQSPFITNLILLQLIRQEI
ncbi:hypothetical protein ABIB50_000299 [Mucilaginibacter sp. UYCu711]